MPRKVFLLLLLALLCLGLSGCTRTVYVVHMPDGGAVELEDKQQADALSEMLALQQRELEEAKIKEAEARERERLRKQVLPKDEVIDVVDAKKDKDNKLEPGVHLGDALEIGIMPVNDFVLVGQTEPVFLQVELGAFDVKTSVRAPINIAIVIDRSGSMSGGKLDRVKEAALWLIDHMQEGDRIAIVSYSSDVRVDAAETLNETSRFTLRTAVKKLNSGGGTFLSGGLETGALQIRDALDREHINRVVLLSDGNANEGIIDPNTLSRMSDVLREDGISVTTMGVGLDYNEDVMQSVALYGGGNYYFIEDAAAMDGIFAAELESLGTIVARDAILELEVPEDVEVQEVYGYNFEREGNILRIPMNSVSSGEKRRVLMAFDVKKAAKSRKQGDELVVTSGRLNFRNELTQKEEQVDLAPVKIGLTNDNTKYASSYHAPVLEKVEAVRNAEAQQQAIAYIEAGDRSNAQKVLKSRSSQAASINSTLGSQALDQQIFELDALAGEVEAMPESKEELDSHRSSSSYKSVKKKSKAKAGSLMAY